MAKPINTQVMTAPVYDGKEMQPYQGRPGANDALELPSRMGNRLHYRDGKTEPV
jgi:hypothetical protein